MGENISANKVKVLFVIPCLCRGGAERIISIILERLDRNKIDLVCIFYKHEHVYNVPMDVKVYCLEIPGTGSISKKFIYAIKRIFRITSLIKSENPDAIFSSLPMVNLVMVLSRLLASILIKKKIKLYIYEVTTLSVHLSTLKKYFGRTIQFFIKALYPRADKIIVNAEGVKSDLVKYFNVPDEKIEVIYSLMDIEEITRLSDEEFHKHPWFKEDVPIIINIGALRIAKAQHYLLQAFKLVREKIDCRLIIIGEGEKKDELKQLSNDLAISDDVAILGFQENIFQFMKRSSVFVLSSIYEGFPTILIEAMASGVPVISTRCPSGPEEVIIDRVNGLLVPVGDYNAIAEAILKVLNDKDMAASFVKEAKKTILRYDVKNAMFDYERLFIEDDQKRLEVLSV